MIRRSTPARKSRSNSRRLLTSKRFAKGRRCRIPSRAQAAPVTRNGIGTISISCHEKSLWKSRRCFFHLGNGHLRRVSQSCVVSPLQCQSNAKLSSCLTPLVYSSFKFRCRDHKNFRIRCPLFPCAVLHQARHRGGRRGKKVCLYHSQRLSLH